MTIELYKGDLPDDLDLGNVVAVDTETLGLIPSRDPLCVVQLSSGDGIAHIVQLDRSSYDCPNLKKLLASPDVLKIFHFARFDIAICNKYLGVDIGPIYCTRTASKLARTYTDRHGLRECCRELLGVEISKQYQSSDWGADELKPEQLKYAANDVYHLHALMAKLNMMLEREGRMELAKKCFAFLPLRAELDMAGWPNIDIFEH
ncbi:MAG: ribonuclease D [Micavibrio sp.]|nr:ribonuclease D [Micavibrio sp.]